MAERLPNSRTERLREGRLDVERGVFMISVAAELAGVHPQTLRIYEARGLISPRRSRGNTRLYSQREVELLRRIQEMTTEMGMNLAGVEAVLRLEHDLERMRGEMAAMKRRAVELEREMDREIERVRNAFRGEIVPWEGQRSLLRRFLMPPASGDTNAP